METAGETAAVAVDRTSRRGADRRNRDAEIVDAAIRVFYEKGYPASSVQDVADIVGVLKGSLYHYIDSKEDLLLRILRESHEQARAIMDRVTDGGGSAVERLGAFLEAMYSWYLDHIERVSVYFNQQQYLTGANRSEIKARARELDRYVRGILVEGVAEGSLRADLDAKLASFFLLGALNSLPVWYRPSGGFSRDRIAREFSRMSVASLGAAP